MRHLVTQTWAYSVRILTAAAVVGMIIAGGLVLASIPDANGVIHGCLVPAAGNIRIIDSSVTGCRPLEQAISWNVQGTAGARGPSDAFLVDQRTSFLSQNLDPINFTDLVKLSLPAGKFVVNATAAVAAGTTFHSVQCLIKSPTAFLSDTTQSEVGGTANSFLTLAVTTAFTLPAAADVSLACRSSADVGTQPSTMTAIQVATLTKQPD